MSNNTTTTDVDRIVFAYLQKKGYKGAIESFKQEANLSSKSAASSSLDPSGNNLDEAVAHYILFHDMGQDGTVANGTGTNLSQIYERSYRKLKSWIENSLDLYKNELYNLLYPLFVHTYLELVSHGQTAEAARFFLESFRGDHEAYYAQDLVRLCCVIEPAHLQENELAVAFRQNKYSVRLCNYSFELFIGFLQENKLMHLLKMVNQYLNIQVYAGNPRSKGAVDDDSSYNVNGITGYSLQQLNSINDERIYWGALPPDPKLSEDVDRVLKEDLVNANIPIDDIQRSLDFMKKTKPPVTEDSPERGRIPLPTLKRSDVLNEIKKLKDLRHRVPLDSKHLPSVLCYTFYNTYDTLNCLSFSPDSSLITCGYSDSYVEVSSLNPNQKLRSLKSSMEIGKFNLSDISDLDALKEAEGSGTKRLIGHGGPVYASKFSYDNRFLITASQDCTARLWSLDTFTNVVVYKGHNSPIWDVDFDPFGYYFATASNDKSARLWSCGHIHPLRIFAGHLSDVDCVKFHPNCNYIATGSSDKTVRLWDIHRGTCVRLFTGHTATVNSLAFSPDGKYLASAGEDRTIQLWDLGSGRRVCKMIGHMGNIYSLDFSKENSVLASGSADNTVRLWDIQGNLGETLVSSTSNNSTGTSSINERKPLATWPTKESKVVNVQFTDRNLLLAGTIYNSSTTNL